MTTIVIHGTNIMGTAQNARWWWDSWNEGGFLNAVARGMADADIVNDVWSINGRDMKEIPELQPKWNLWIGRLGQISQYKGLFYWGGLGTDMGEQRHSAGTWLARYLNKLQELAPDEPLRIIAHSHGCNVVKLASSHRKLNPDIYIDQAVFLGCPHFKDKIKDTYIYQLNPQRFGTILNLYSKNDTVQTTFAEKFTGVSFKGFRVSGSHREEQDPNAAGVYENYEIPTAEEGINSHTIMHGVLMGYMIGLWLGGSGDFQSILEKVGNDYFPIPEHDNGEG